jgi:hypothetical protein
MGDLRRISKLPSPEVEAWVSYLKKALKLRRLSNYGGEDKFVKTAARIALFGPPGESRATDVYQALVSLLFSYHRIQQWDAMLNKLPSDKEGIMRVVKALQASGLIEGVERANFGPQTFLEVAMQLPDPKAYVEVCKREGHKMVRSAFHPNTLTYIKNRYRGVVGPLADPEYGKQIASIPTIT